MICIIIVNFGIIYIFKGKSDQIFIFRYKTLPLGSCYIIQKSQPQKLKSKSKMNQEDEQFLTDQPIKFLTLLPPRKVQSVQFSIEKLEKLYQSVKCSICLELLTNPVYLKCSHRFCKECIEKFIRTNQNKSCPNCRGELSTRRDLGQDYILTTIMTYAFGDLSKLKERIKKAEEKLVGYQKGFNTIPPQILERRKQEKLSGSGKKLNSSKSVNSSNKRERPNSQNQEMLREGLNLKKKESEMDEKNKAIQEIKIQLIRNESNMSSTKVKGAKKKQQIIEISSSQPDQGVEIIEKPSISNIEEDKQESFKEKEPTSTIQLRSNKEIIKQERINKRNEKIQEDESIEASFSTTRQRKKRQKRNQIQPVPLLSAQPRRLRPRKIIEVTVPPQPVKSVVAQSPKQTKQLKQKKEPKQITSHENQYKSEICKQLEQLQTLSQDKELLQARQLLKDHFGSMYLNKLFEYSQDRFMIRIRLEKLPKNYLTPVLPQKQLYVSLKSQLGDISRMIANKLNLDSNKSISFHVEKISTENSSVSVFQELADIKQTLLDINQGIWKLSSGIERFGIESMQNFLTRQQKSKTNITKSRRRILFYSVKKDILLAKK